MSEIVLYGHTATVKFLITGLPEGRIASATELAERCPNTTIRIWNSDGTAHKLLEGHTGAITGLLLLRDGRLASTNWDGTIRMWDTVAGICEEVVGGCGTILTLIQLTDGRLAGGSRTGTVKIWELGTPTRCTRTLTGHWGHVVSLQQMPDGRLISSCEDNTLRIWEV